MVFSYRKFNFEKIIVARFDPLYTVLINGDSKQPSKYTNPVVCVGKSRIMFCCKITSLT